MGPTPAGSQARGDRLRTGRLVRIDQRRERVRVVGDRVEVGPGDTMRMVNGLFSAT